MSFFSCCQIVRFIMLVPNCPVPNCPTIMKHSSQIQRSKLTKQVDWLGQSTAAQWNWFCSKVSIILLWNGPSLWQRWIKMKNRKNSKVSITLPRSGPSLQQRWRVYSIQRSDLSCVQHFKLENSLLFLQHFKLENSSRLSWRSIKKKSADYFSKEIQRNAFRVWMYCRMTAEPGSRDNILIR